MGYYKDLIKQSISRSKEASLSILGISDEGLREHLNNSMSEELGAEGCFLAPPVFEQTFGWQAGDKKLSELSGNLISETMINTLDSAKTYRFHKGLTPYKHQLTAWKSLTQDEARSAVVTTGTGSGKTECFMIPIIDDLIKEYQAKQKPLVGVRALFLYPLNALINSQQERLNAWTEDFEDNIRFCLYNGKTEELQSKIRKDPVKREIKNQILSRELLRKEPAPILMTNATMLEYMLVRQIDSPILEISKQEQSLKWIVLDEAHTYIGSQAAEISLLLRRVVHAFGKSAGDIRFVATSATIADKDAENQLRNYLADLAGVPTSQVDVITGSREWPKIDNAISTPAHKYEEIASIDQDKEISEARYNALSSHPIAAKLRSEIIEHERPQNINELIGTCSHLLTGESKTQQQDEIINWIDLMSGTKKNDIDPPFLKLRVHLFQKMLHGLWSCVDPSCTCKSTELKEWPFGNVYVSQKPRCSCGAPIYEIGFCNDCRAPHLVAEDQKGVLNQKSIYSDDEFSFTQENRENDPHTNLPDDQKTEILISPNSIQEEPYFLQNFDLEKQVIGSTSGSKVIKINMSYKKEAKCFSCKHTGLDGYDFYKMSYLGAPFYIANAVPTILEYCPDPDKKDCNGRSPSELPGRGRKLITFTDSRQGTARMAVKMQQEAERSRLRGLIFEIVRNAQKKDSQESENKSQSISSLEVQANRLREMGLTAEAEEMMNTIRALGGSSTAKKLTVSWTDMVAQLAESKDITHSILDYNKYANPILFENGNKENTMARVLLAREFARRPKLQNSLETLGLIAVGYEGIEAIQNPPEMWTNIGKRPKYQSEGSKNLNLQDWKDYLKVSLDFYVRDNTYIRLEKNMQKWMGSNFYAKSFLPPTDSAEDGKSIKKWPYFDDQSGRKSRNRLVKILQETTELDSKNSADRDIMNLILEAAWKVLTELEILQHFEYGHSLNIEKLNFSFPEKGWICPTTHKIIDTTFCGVTPYLPNKMIDKNYKCEKIELPKLKEIKPQNTEMNRINQIRDLVAEDEIINSLRTQNLWTDISDRTVEGGFYYRTAEHSAQQSSTRLETYEAMFKIGKVNVLNCSTTMEMGVDIGGVSAVVMNNVPPHPANYLQRAGRAGRRSESRAIAYTLCKADPHNQRAFNKPTWPFETAIAAPSITLSSKQIVHRHVNSLLLAKFLLEQTSSEKQNTSLNVKWFFGGEGSRCNKFIDWLETSADEVEDAVLILTHNTALSSSNIRNILKGTVEHIQFIQEKWVNEYENINQRSANATEEAYKKALEHELERHEKEYLLRNLAERAFLPGYGFPTNVVNFNTYNISDYKYEKERRRNQSREDSVFNFKEQPSRSLEIAIREYAPGSQLVIDGRVYRSAGISLDWTNPDRAHHFDLAWQCHKCGMNGVSEYAYTTGGDIRCHSCHTAIKPENKKMVLKPTGFVNDFYEEPNNDISSQKFIKMKKPRIQLNGEEQSFPDQRCGSFRYGNKGNVFYHSSGENDNGYAVCLKCGRTESMTATGELPGIFKKYTTHVALGGPDKQGSEKNCERENVKENIYLGFQIKTDVIEFLIKNPLTGSWLGDSEDEKIIATTLAVAIRNSIAELIGISSTEMGYGYRLDKDLETGAPRSVIQIYDNVSGGAGFVLAGLKDINDLLKRAILQLDCPEKCKNVCSHCLAGMDSRIETSELDRKLTLKWIEESRFMDHLSFPEDQFLIPSPVFCSYGPYRYIKDGIDKLQSSTQDQTTVSIFLHSDIDQWDLHHPQFHDMIMNWMLINRAKIELNIPERVQIPESLYSILYRLSNSGISFNRYEDTSEKDKAYLFCQIFNSDCTLSLYSNNESAILPGPEWLNPTTPTTWIGSDSAPIAEKFSIDASQWNQDQNNTTVINVIHELNGPLSSLTARMEDLFSDTSDSIFRFSKGDSVKRITYSDRYLRSPWTILMLGEFLKYFQRGNLEEVEILTANVFQPNKPYRCIYHNWRKDSDIKAVAEAWIGEQLNCPVSMTVHEKQHEIAHGRIMDIEWESGIKTQILFDQGVGPWQSDFPRGYMQDYKFFANIPSQISQLKEKYPKVNMKRNEGWPTYLTVKELE
ncbi:MAG: DEAD/DEAH box helicase [Spirochaetales bacterium]|nr:DEAD/DEAH box helicase [Spirochaetales bacterium]